MREDTRNKCLKSLLAITVVFLMASNVYAMIPQTLPTTIVEQNVPFPDGIMGPDVLESGADFNSPTGSEGDEEPLGWVDGDFIISSPTDLNEAVNPVVYTTPHNPQTLGFEMAGSIHAVWSEYDEYAKVYEIHYSMTHPKFANYPLEWTGEKEDRIISEIMIEPPKSGTHPMGHAANPGIVVDDMGVIHVVWAQEYIDTGNWESVGWKIHYAFSIDNGMTWSSDLGQEPGRDIVISYPGSLPDTVTAPNIARGKDGDLGAPDPLYVVWSENYGNEQQEVYFSGSLDGGKTWSGVEKPNQIGTLDGNKARSPSVGATGTFGEIVHVAWTQYLNGDPKSGDEIYYLRSTDKGKNWSKEHLISNPQDHFSIGHVDVATGMEEIFIVWNQTSLDPEKPAAGVYYAASFTDGDKWEHVELPISYYDPKTDPSPARAPSVGATNPVDGKAGLEVHVAWTEFDDAAGTYEVHYSMNSDPLNPEGWTGLREDIVLSWPDGLKEANAENVSLSMGFVQDSWAPQIVWDEPNYNSQGTRADKNHEIHYNPPPPPPPEWTLSTSVDGSGTIVKDPDQSTYSDGTTVQLTANPSTGFSFSQWSGALSGSTNPQSLYMDGDKSVTAHFTQNQYTLTVNIFGSGSVSKSPNQSTYTYGQNVQLTANPAFGWTFSHWGGALGGSSNPDSIVITSSTTVNAYFARNIYNISLSMGWNMVSLPFVQGNTSVSSVLSSINGVYESVKYYDILDVADPWKSYRPGGTVNDLTDIDHTMAIWIRVNASCTLTVYGDKPASTAIPLYKGWNFVGYPSETSRLASSTLPLSADIVSIFNATTPYVTDVTDLSTVTFSRGNGYWVHVTADATWTVPW